MLTSIREKATGWIAWIIVIIIVIPFALWGINSYFEGASNLPVAEVNGQEINDVFYRDALDNQRNAIRNSLGRNVPLEFLDGLPFKTRVVEGLISDTLLLEDAEDQGYRIGDLQLSSLIRSTPQFQKDGQFDQETYNYVLRNAGYSISGFEESQRRQALTNQVARTFQQSTFIMDADIDAVIRLQFQQRTADYVVFKTADFEQDIQISEEDIKSDYEKNIKDYQNPARIKVEYIELSVADLMQTVDIDEAELKQVYEQTKRQYTDPEERRASHILLTIKSDADAAAQQLVLDKANELLAEIRQGSDFAALATAHSQDPGSSAKGGDLGVITPGAMVKPFEEAVLALTEGEVSDPVKTTYGYHLIKLTALVPEKIRSFEDARQGVETQLKNQQAENRFLELSETFRNLVYEQPDSLQPAADELGLSIKESDWFARSGGSGLASFSSVQEAAFGDDVMRDGLNSEAVEAGVDILVSLRRKDFQDSGAKPLIEVSEIIRSKLLREAASKTAEKQGKAALAALQDGKSWNDIVRQYNMESKTFSGQRSSASAGDERELVALLFSTTRPADGAPVYNGNALNSGGYIVFQLRAVVDADAGKITAEERSRIHDQMLRRRGGELFSSYRQGLRQNADIKIYSEQL